MPNLRRIDPGLLLVAAAAVAVSVQQGVALTHPGNFLRFRATFHRLVSGADIYTNTGFLYSPTFALLFAPFAILPLALGLLCWNGVNALSLYGGLTKLLPARAAHMALLIVFLDLIRSLQNSQSNALVAGLMVLAFVALERDRLGAGASAIVTAAFIKIYPVAAGVLGLLRPRPWMFLAVFLALGLLFVALPLIALPPAAFVATYREWWSITQHDAILQGQSVMRVISAIAGWEVPTIPIQLIATLLLLAPLAALRRCWSEGGFRMRWLCSLLVFCVIFNHQAESPSFVVASSGVAIWYVTTLRAWWRTTLLALMLALETVPHLFFVPQGWYTHVIEPNALDAVPCFVIWLVIQYELWRWPDSRDKLNVSPREAVTNLP
jgi:Glycosyltransferase family 87